MASSSIQWRGTVEMGRNCTIYGNKVIEAVLAVGNYIAPLLETFSKREGKWQDRTGNLRQTLRAWAEQTSKDIVSIFLSHGMYYSVFTETVSAGKFAIIWPTLQAHIQTIYNMLRGIFG